MIKTDSITSLKFENTERFFKGKKNIYNEPRHDVTQKNLNHTYSNSHKKDHIRIYSSKYLKIDNCTCMVICTF